MPRPITHDDLQDFIDGMTPEKLRQIQMINDMHKYPTDFARRAILHPTWPPQEKFYMGTDPGSPNGDHTVICRVQKVGSKFSVIHLRASDHLNFEDAKFTDIIEPKP